MELGNGLGRIAEVGAGLRRSLLPPPCYFAKDLREFRLQRALGLTGWP
jgi:hypothetical protein